MLRNHHSVTPALSHASLAKHAHQPAQSEELPIVFADVRSKTSQDSWLEVRMGVNMMSIRMVCKSVSRLCLIRLMKTFDSPHRQC